MKIILAILFLSSIFTIQVSGENSRLTIDPFTDQILIDELWIDYMIYAPNILDLLARMIVMTSANDIPLNSTGYAYQYVRYPQSFRATLIQISNEGYQAFLNAHSSINRLQLYLKQIPERLQTIMKIVSRNVSVQVASRLLERSIEHFNESLIKDSFTPVLNLINEVLQVHIHENPTEIDRDDHCYSSIHPIIRKAFDEYSQILRNLPIGLKKLADPLGRMAIQLSNTLGQCQMELNLNSTIQKKLSVAIVSTFNELIQRESNIDLPELRSYKIVFNSYKNLMEFLQKVDVIDRIIEFIDHRIENNNSENIDQLKISVANNFNDSSSNDPLTKTGLAKIQQHFNRYYNLRLTKMSVTRGRIRNLTQLGTDKMNSRQIMAMLEEVKRLFVALQSNWRLSNRIVTNFGEKLRTFIKLEPSGFQILLEDPSSISRESYVLYIMSRTCYDISSKYLMPRVASLSRFLATKTTDDREKLAKDIAEVQREVKKLIEERKSLLKKVMQKKRAQIN